MKLNPKGLEMEDNRFKESTIISKNSLFTHACVDFMRTRISGIEVLSEDCLKYREENGKENDEFAIGI